MIILMKKKILIIDDELELRHALNERLTSVGYSVIEAWNGREGLEKVVTEKPDLILLDLTMPEMDGMTTLQELRRCEETKRIPVIIMTAKGETVSIMDFQALKVADYFTKPFDSKELISYIERYI